jgi:hypothetical protein
MTKSPKVPESGTNPPDWKPSPDILQKLKKQGIETSEIDLLLKSFEQHPDYLKDARNTRFMKFAMLRAGQSLKAEIPEQPIPIDWWPSEEIINAVVSKTGIAESEIPDLVPEFVLYWRERGETANSWGQKFLRFAEMRSEYKYPSRIRPDWWPSEDASRLLQLYGFREEQIEIGALEFRMFHRDANTRQLNWNESFAKWMKGHR